MVPGPPQAAWTRGLVARPSPPPAGMGHFPLLLQWDTQTLGTYFSRDALVLGTQAPTSVRNSLCQPIQVPPNSSYPGARRLHPTHSTLVPSRAPCCPHGPQHSQGQALAKESSDLQHSFSLQINNPRPAAGHVGCSMGDPHELGHP